MTAAVRPAARAPTEVDIHVGARIRELRQDKNLTLAELAAGLGISHQQLQKYETGTNRLSAGILFDVAAALRVHIEELFPGAGTREDLPRKYREAERKLDEIRRLVGGPGRGA